MQLDTTFLSTEAATPAAEAPVETVNATEVPSTETTPDLSAYEVQPAEAPAEAVTPAVPVEEVISEDEALSEEDLQKLAASENSPKWFRDQLKKVSGYTNKLKTERDTVQQEYEAFKTQYESSQIPETDLERLRQAEERQYKLSAFSTTPEDILGSLQEIVPSQKIQEVRSHLAWEFLETPDGRPDAENLQVVIDRFTGYKEGDTRVKSADVLNAIEALKRGTLSPADLNEFGSDAEYQAFEKARQMEQQISEREQLARANAEFQETQTRQSLLRGVSQQVQSQFQPRVENLLNKFQLMPVEGEPKVATEMKAAIQNKLVSVIQDAQARSTHFSDVLKGIEMLGKANGATPEKIQQEINSFTNSFPYQTALNKGLNELIQAVEKTVAQEAYVYSLAMEGYAARAAKGQGAREVIGAPNQTEVLTQYTPEQLAGMSANERRQNVLKQVSEQIRASVKNTDRFGNPR